MRFLAPIGVIVAACIIAFLLALDDRTVLAGIIALASVPTALAAYVVMADRE